MMIFLAILIGLAVAALAFGAFVFFGDRIRVFTSRSARTHSLTSVFPRRVPVNLTPAATNATPAGSTPAAQTSKLPWYSSAWNKIKEKWILAVLATFVVALMVLGPREHKATIASTAPPDKPAVSETTKEAKKPGNFLAGLPIVGHLFQGPSTDKVARLIVLAVQQTESGRGLDDFSFPYGDDKPRNILGLGCPEGDGLTFDQAFSNIQRSAFGNSEQKGKFTFATEWQFQMGLKRTIDQLKRDRTPRDILTHWDTEVKGYTKSHRAYDDALVDAFVSVSGGEYQIDTPCSRIVNSGLWDYHPWTSLSMLILLIGLFIPGFLALIIRYATAGKNIHVLLCWLYWLASGIFVTCLLVWALAVPNLHNRAPGAPIPDWIWLSFFLMGLAWVTFGFFPVIFDKKPERKKAEAKPADTKGKEEKKNK